MNHVQSIKWHAMGIRDHLGRLAEIAQKHEALQPEIQGFFGEAFFNVLTILAECQDRMPETDKDDTMQIRRDRLDSTRPLAMDSSSRSNTLIN